MVRLKKSLGQHLLISPGILQKIAEKAEIKEGDIVVEIGPGTGALTKYLLQYPLKRLYLLEIDPEMIKELRSKFSDERLTIYQADAVSFNYRNLGEGPLKVVGNLPYNVASLIIENVVYYHVLIPQVVVLVQKEVAEKWLTQGSWLSIFIQTFYDLDYIMTIPPRFFHPPPKVDSSLIKLSLHVKTSLADLAKYKNFLTHLFQHKRKMLRKKFPAELLEKSQIDGHLRVEALSLGEILRLYEHFIDWLEPQVK
uniref:Ribosomal RNA small subunit methyltransferase A n=1 Tax=Caldimicrobium thiodismutans TaxID=1653476 RepID=A0A832GQU6_9BACT